jgi:hypothetical protein
MPFNPYVGFDSLIADEIRLRLTWLSYLAFAIACRYILSESGLSDITLSSRKHLKGRVASGSGFDMTASYHTESGRIRALVTLKRYTHPVSAAAVDLLRGAMAKEHASVGLIVTTASFSDKAREAALADPTHPVHLIDGRQLSALALACGFGVADIANPVGPGRIVEYSDASFVACEEEAARHLEAPRTVQKKGGL